MSKRRGGNAPEIGNVRYVDGEHRLILINRNDADYANHRHPWQASCVCGWRAVATRRRQEAEGRYRQHKNGAEHTAKRTRERFDDETAVRRLTPTAQLPEALR